MPDATPSRLRRSGLTCSTVYIFGRSSLSLRERSRAKIDEEGLRWFRRFLRRSGDPLLEARPDEVILWLARASGSRRIILSLVVGI
jgi:hypothetical protein